LGRRYLLTIDQKLKIKIAQQQLFESQHQITVAELRLQQEQERSQLLAEYLRSLGVDPDSLS